MFITSSQKHYLLEIASDTRDLLPRLSVLVLSETMYTGLHSLSGLPGASRSPLRTMVR